MPSLASPLPRELLDDIVAHVTEFEDDQVTVKTLYSMALSCRALFYPAIEGLYLDPSRAWACVTWQRGVNLLHLLKTRSNLARSVKKLVAFAEFTERMSFAAEDTIGLDEEASTWVVEFLRTCVNLEELTTLISFQDRTHLVVSTISSLPSLDRLTIQGIRRPGELMVDAQAFVAQLHPKQGRLLSLQVSGFGRPPFQPYLAERIPHPRGFHPWFEIESIFFDHCDQDIAWSPWFLPTSPRTLHTLVFESRLELRVEAEALTDLLPKVSDSLKEFTFRGKQLNRAAIVGSLDHYDHIPDVGTSLFPFQTIPETGLRFLTTIAFEGIHTVHLGAFQRILITCPVIESISFFNSVWRSAEWHSPSLVFELMLTWVDSFSHSLRFLHLGHVPLLAQDIFLWTAKYEFQMLEVELEWQPCLDEPSEWEQAQAAAEADDAESDDESADLADLFQRALSWVAELDSRAESEEEQ